MQDSPTWHVRWQKWSGMTSWYACIKQPRVEHGCLIVEGRNGAAVWVPLHTITGHIEFEQLDGSEHG